MFEWDEKKRAANLANHGVDFRVAAGIFAGPVIEAPDDRQDYGEQRYRALGCVAGQYFVVVYTWRGEHRRLISAWKAGRDERERYEDLFSS